MTTLGQAARLTEHGKTILARVISGGIFAGSKEDSVSKIEGAESARVYPFPAPVETPAELRTRLIFWHGWWRAPKYLSPPAAFGERRHGGFATTIWV